MLGQFPFLKGTLNTTLPLIILAFPAQPVMILQTEIYCNPKMSPLSRKTKTGRLG